jgi:Secretion system C-terminal sorting domain
MKNKLIIIMAITLLQLTVTAQNCNIGNQTKTSSFKSPDVSLGSDVIAGIKRNLPKESTLTSINMIGNNTQSKFKMAVYTDSNGKPSKLMAQSQLGTVGLGVVSLPVTRTLLPAGDYWIVAIYQQNNLSQRHTDLNLTASNNTYTGVQHSFNSAFPSTLTGANTYKGLDYLYFLSLDCGNTLSAKSFESNNDITIHPNPSSSFITITGNLSEKKYSILNALGSIVQQGTLTDNATIDIQRLSKGVYFIRLEKTKAIRFLKN